MKTPIETINRALEGRYSVERELGEGGMAKVYLAEDLKHHRKVALKVLKPELAAVVGGERFLTEIETTANLQHPHILPLFDSGEADGLLFYVMPFIEGETLRDRLDRERQLPVDEAIRVASDLAEALDYAHRNGVVHRDIKPANILLHEGRPLIADFGIALAVGAAGGARLTETGLSVGTPYYMSPEQATGDQAVGPASDTYALGCVLYEMLVGEPPYLGNTAQAVLGKIIQGAPVSATAQRRSIPLHVDATIRCALEKLPADRFGSAREFAAALAHPAFRHGEELRATTGVVGSRRLGTAILAGLAGAFAALSLWALTRPAPDAPVTRVSVFLPEGQRLHNQPQFDLSQDGSLIVYRGVGSSGRAQLWVRRWDALDATPIADTEGADYPALSPDGREVAFRVGGVARVLPIQGGVSRTLADSVLCCIRWGHDGSWVYYQNAAFGINRVPSGGGPVEVVTVVDTARGDTSHEPGDELPGGEALVYEVEGAGDSDRVDAVDLESGEVKTVTPGQFPRYAATGHLLFLSDDDVTLLLAAPLDAGRLELTGVEVPVLEGVGAAGALHQAAVSRDGTLVYIPPNAASGQFIPVWVDREGSSRPIDPNWSLNPGNNNRGLALSPDGTRLAVGIVEGGPEDIWIKQLPDGPLARLTVDAAQDVRPKWTPDGRYVTFISDRQGTNNGDLYIRAADGTGVDRLLVDIEAPVWEGLTSDDGSWSVVRTGGTLQNPGGRDVLALQTGVDSVPRELVVTDFDEKAIDLSPDGRWLVYESDETGRNEIYVRPFPNIDAGKWTVSTNGGVMPLWSHSGRELFYVDAEGQMMAAQIASGAAFEVTERRPLFRLSSDLLITQVEQYTLYDVSPDDQTFVMLQARDPTDEGVQLILVRNWYRELEARVGG